MAANHALLTIDFLAKKSYEGTIIAVSNSSLDITSSNSTADNNYGFVMTVKSSGKAVLLVF